MSQPHGRADPARTGESQRSSILTYEIFTNFLIIFLITPPKKNIFQTCKGAEELLIIQSLFREVLPTRLLVPAHLPQITLGVALSLLGLVPCLWGSSNPVIYFWLRLSHPPAKMVVLRNHYKNIIKNKREVPGEAPNNGLTGPNWYWVKAYTK